MRQNATFVSVVCGVRRLKKTPEKMPTPSEDNKQATELLFVCFGVV